MEATTGFEPVVETLQASALPLGHVAFSCAFSCAFCSEKKADLRFFSVCRPDPASGADNGIRTRDPNLGKVVLYQLSHVRMRD